MLDLKKINKKVIVAVCILFAIAVWTAAYLACSSSDAYHTASEFVSNNTVIAEKTGKIIKSRLGFYNFRVSENLKHGSAEFAIVVSGEKTSVDVWFLLAKDSASGWVVKRAALDEGKETLVLLDNP